MKNLEKVYLLWRITEYEEENDELLRVFGSKDKAEEYCKEKNITLGSTEKIDSTVYELEECKVY